MTSLADLEIGSRKFELGDRVEKAYGSQWRGTVVGYYRTRLTPEGYCVESDAHDGAVRTFSAAELVWATT